MYKFFALTMAALVMLSSTSFSVSTHYCNGQVANITFFFENDSCAKETPFSCADSSEEHLEEDACCATETSFVDGSDFQDKQDSFSVNVKIAYTIPFYKQYSFVKTFWKTLKVKFHHSFPPLIKNFTLLFETYLI